MILGRTIFFDLERDGESLHGLLDEADLKRFDVLDNMAAEPALVDVSLAMAAPLDG